MYVYYLLILINERGHLDSHDECNFIMWNGLYSKCIILICKKLTKVYHFRDRYSLLRVSLV